MKGSHRKIYEVQVRMKVETQQENAAGVSGGMTAVASIGNVEMQLRVINTRYLTPWKLAPDFRVRCRDLATSPATQRSRRKQKTPSEQHRRTLTFNPLDSNDMAFHKNKIKLRVTSFKENPYNMCDAQRHQ